MSKNGTRTIPVFWTIAIVLSLLLAYPIPFGPACWWQSRTAKGGPEMARFYRPIGCVLDGKNSASRFFSWYGSAAASGRGASLAWDPKDGPVWYVDIDCPLIGPGATSELWTPVEEPVPLDNIDNSVQSHPVPDYVEPRRTGAPDN